MTQIEKIEYQTKQLQKVIASHGADSNYTTNAFFVLQAMKMNIADPYKWALNEMERLHQIALDQLPSMFETPEPKDTINGWTSKTPTECGTYAWRENNKSKPYHILAFVTKDEHGTFIKLDDDSSLPDRIENIAKREWLKIPS
jgi:hypothetical protein